MVLVCFNKNPIHHMISYSLLLITGHYGDPVIWMVVLDNQSLPVFPVFGSQWGKRGGQSSVNKLGDVPTWYSNPSWQIQSLVDSLKYEWERTQDAWTMHWDPITPTTFGGGLCHMWPHSFSSGNSNSSWVTLTDRLLIQLLLCKWRHVPFNNVILI